MHQLSAVCHISHLRRYSTISTPITRTSTSCPLSHSLFFSLVLLFLSLTLTAAATIANILPTAAGAATPYNMPLMLGANPYEQMSRLGIYSTGPNSAAETLA